MRILTCAQIKQAEDDAVKAGTSYRQLMENAGAVAAAAIQQLAQTQSLPKTALLLCGKGNNAGDAFVLARLLAAQGWQIEILLLCGNGFSPLAEQNRQILPAAVRQATAETANYTAAFLVDAVFGTGFKGTLPPAAQSSFALANNAPGVRIALDIPSGLEGDGGAVQPGGFKAHYTFTFGAYKPALVMPQYSCYTGRVACLDIGL